MKKNIKKAAMMSLILSIFFCYTVILTSCQQEEVIADADLLPKKAVIAEIFLDYPEEIMTGEEFDIEFSANCGKIMIERAYINGDPIEESGEIIGYEKVYAGLTFEIPGLLWEAFGDNIYLSCQGGKVTQTLNKAGTYVYRAKLNQTAYKKSDCPNCGSFLGNAFENFMITVTENNQGTFTDTRDGKIYKWVKIGDQVWMAENLAFLPLVSPSSQSSEAEPGYHVYDYAGTDVESAKATDNYKTYGVLYNWPAAKAACPTGWHLPANAEWTTLANYLGGWSLAGGKMKSVTGWESPNTGATNSSGFSALPAGFRNAAGGTFSGAGRFGYWWESSDYGTVATIVYLDYNSAEVMGYSTSKKYGSSVRCVRD